MSAGVAGGIELENSRCFTYFTFLKNIVKLVAIR